MYAGLPFCSDECVGRFQAAVAEQMLPADELDRRVREVFSAPCPECGRASGNDLYSATTVTTALIVYWVESRRRLSCAGCGRSGRLRAAAHCMVLGWWGPRAAFFNFFVLPANLVAAVAVRTPRQPSAALRGFVLSRLGAALVSGAGGAPGDRPPEDAEPAAAADPAPRAGPGH